MQTAKTSPTCRYALAPATATAPAGSRMDRVSLKTSCALKGSHVGLISLHTPLPLACAALVVANMAANVANGGLFLKPPPLQPIDRKVSDGQVVRGQADHTSMNPSRQVDPWPHLDGSRGGGVIHQYHAVNQVAAQPERLGAHILDRHAICGQLVGTKHVRSWS